MINEVKWFDETKPTGCSTLSGLDQRVEWIRWWTEDATKSTEKSFDKSRKSEHNESHTSVERIGFWFLCKGKRIKYVSD